MATGGWGTGVRVEIGDMGPGELGGGHSMSNSPASFSRHYSVDSEQRVLLVDPNPQ